MYSYRHREADYQPDPKTQFTLRVGQSVDRHQSIRNPMLPTMQSHAYESTSAILDAVILEFTIGTYQSARLGRPSGRPHEVRSVGIADETCIAGGRFPVAFSGVSPIQVTWFVRFRTDKHLLPDMGLQSPGKQHQRERPGLFRFPADVARLRHDHTRGIDR